MGKNPFEDDSDVQAMRASMRPAAGPMRWGRVLTGALVVGCATFAFAYHLPLQRAHATLTQRFGELQSQIGSATRSAEEARKQAKALEEKQQALDGHAAQAEQAAKAQTQASQTIESALATKLQKLAAKDHAAIGVTGTQVVASLSLAPLLTPGKVEVSPQGKATLCSVATASGDRSIRVLAVVDKKSIPPALAAKLKTPLQYSTALSQAVTETLLDKCSVPAARLSAVGVPAEPPAPSKIDGKKLSGPRIELWLE